MLQEVTGAVTLQLVDAVLFVVALLEIVNVLVDVAYDPFVALAVQGVRLQLEPVQARTRELSPRATMLGPSGVSCPKADMLADVLPRAVPAMHNERVAPSSSRLRFPGRQRGRRALR